MTDTPGWIGLIFNRKTAYHALHTAFLLDLNNEQIASEADGQPNGRADLRRESLAIVRGDAPGAVAMALVYLGIVGEPEDLSQVDGFLFHSDNLVRRAAKTCRFEIVQRSRG